MYKRWATNIGEEKIFDTLIILCMDEYPWKSVKRVYIIPLRFVLSTGITIARNSVKWEKFRIEERQFDDIYNSLLLYFKDKKFDIENIKKWLEGQ